MPNSIGKSGGELSLSAKSDKNARKYLGDMDTPLPEKFRYKKQEDPQNMETVKPSLFSKKKDSPSRVGEFAFDTGWMEIGYDEKKKDTVVSLKSNYRNEDSRHVSENSARKIHVHDGEEIKSNDDEFSSGAVSLRCDSSKNYKRIRNQWGLASKKKDNQMTYDDVMPFHQIEKQKQKIEQLRELKKNSKNERTEIQTAITGVQTYINKKDKMNLEFNQKFERAIDGIKTNFRSGDDYLLFVKKQLLAAKKIAEDGVIIDEKDIEIDQTQVDNEQSQQAEAKESK